MKQTSSVDLSKLWSDLGIQEGDAIFIHSFLAALGHLSDGPSSLLETLTDAVGTSGHIVVPTFTYSIFRGECFDLSSTPSRVGVLGEVVRKDYRASRSSDPAFSMAAIGPKAEWLMQRTSIRAFGPDTIYDRLMEFGAKALLLGVGYEALSLFMHLERLLGVPYRYEKRFYGQSCGPEGSYPDELIHFVRRENSGLLTNRTAVGVAIDQRAGVQTVHYGSEHRLVAFKEVREVVADEVGRDPLALMDIDSKDAA